MPTSAVERAVRSVRRRLAAQQLLDQLVYWWAVSLGVSLVCWFVQPEQWWLPITFFVIATIVAVARVVRKYPTPLTASLELDSRFGLQERVTAAVGLSGEQQGSEVGQAVRTDAEKVSTNLPVRAKFPLRLPRSAWRVPLLAGLLAIVAFVWNPLTDADLFGESETKQAELAKKKSDNPLSPATNFPPPNPKNQAPDRPNAEKLAAIRADLDRLERERKQRETDPKWVAELTAAEDAARAVERETLDRLARMEAQLKQLEPLGKSPDFKDKPAGNAANALSQGELDEAKKALEELAKNAAEKPNDPELRKQIEQLKDEIRKAAENTAAKEKLEKLIDQAKKDGRDTSGLQQELDRAKGEQSQDLKDLADKLEQAGKQLEKGDGTEAAKQLKAAAEAVGEIQKDAQTAQGAQGEVQRAEQLRAMAGMQGDDGKGDPMAGMTDANGNPVLGPKSDQKGPPGGTGGVADKPTGPGKEPKDNPRDTRVRIPFADPKGAMTRGGSGDFGGGFTPKDAKQLAPAIQDAARNAPATVAGQPLTPGDRNAVREFFERLGAPMK